MALELIRYGTEMVRDRAFYGAALEAATGPEGLEQLMSVQSLMGISAMGLLSRQTFDMAHTGESPNIAARDEVARIGGITLLAVDVVDDEVDRLEMPVDEKFRYLDAWLGMLREGRTDMLSASYPQGGNPALVGVSLDLARYLHQRATDSSDPAALFGTVAVLVEDAKRQMVSPDLDEQFALTLRVGEGCGAIASSALATVEGVAYPPVVDAQMALGGYAECINHAYEIQEDLDEGTLSYTTLYLATHGDTEGNRRHLKQLLVETANELLAEGMRGLNRKQSNIMFSAKNLIDLKYKVLGRLAKPAKTAAGNMPDTEASVSYA